MTRIFPLAAALIAAAIPLSVPASAQAQGVFVAPPPGIAQPARPLTGIRANIARNLPRYGFGGVDVARLSAVQVSHIHHLIHSGRSEGDVRGQIGATLRRGLLQRGVDRVIR